MICVSIGRGRHRMLMAEHKHLAEMGIELVELRLDYIRRPVNMRRLLKDRPGPVIATCRRVQEGGRWQRTEQDRLYLLRTAIADGADYVDLEVDIAQQIPRYGDTQRIVSYHNFHETPDDLESIHERMAECDPDMIKIATMANDPTDNFKTLRICESKNSIPTVAFCMGEMGMPSRILCGRFGAPMTYATFNPDRLLAPGMLTYQQMTEEFHFNDISRQTAILGVIGDPIKQSLSPLIHNAAIRDAGLDFVYLPFRVPAQALDSFMNGARQLGVRGLSVTIPHKEDILRHLDAMDDNVVGIRAANTVVFKEEQTRGFNTDCDAAIESLKQGLANAIEDDRLEDRVVLILGAGGVARALGVGLQAAGAKVHICARDHRKGAALANHIGCQSIDWVSRQNFDYQILINCTPVGMHPNLDESPIEAAWLDRKSIIFDTIYNPEQTLLIKQAREKGCDVITGVDMFVRQAAKQFELFCETTPNQKLIRKTIKRATSAARY